jgi:hypothetical protein
MFLGPFALALVAAAVRRYPYGGEARQMQFVAPMICTLAALGIAVILRAIPRPGFRDATAKGVLVSCVVGAVVMASRDVAQPYRFPYDRQAREFAKAFWPAQANDAEVVCLHWDFAIFQRPGLNLRTALYLCNQFIYSPRRQRTSKIDWHAVREDRPLRCMLYCETRPDYPDVLAWFARYGAVYDVRRSERVGINPQLGNAQTKQDHLLVFELVPKRSAQAKRSAPGPIADPETVYPRIAAGRVGAPPTQPSPASGEGRTTAPSSPPCGGGPGWGDREGPDRWGPSSAVPSRNRPQPTRKSL